MFFWGQKLWTLFIIIDIITVFVHFINVFQILKGMQSLSQTPMVKPFDISNLVHLIWQSLHSLKYLRSTTLGFKYTSIRKLEFVAKTQFLSIFGKHLWNEIQDYMAVLIRYLFERLNRQSKKLRCFVYF